MFPAKAAPDHCSEVAVDQTLTRPGAGPFLGYNYDMLVAGDRVLVEGFLALFVVEPVEGLRYVAPNTMGSIGLNTAMNAAGVTFGWDNSYLKSGVKKGTNQNPYMLILRDLALSAHTREEAIDRFRQEQRQEADMSIIADHTGVVVVELAADQMETRTAAVVWSCNRLQALAALDYHGAGKPPDGRSQRYAVLSDQLQYLDAVDVQHIAAILRDTDHDAGRPIASDRTTFTVIYDLAATKLWLSFHGSPSATERLYAFNSYGERLERVQKLCGILRSMNYPSDLTNDQWADIEPILLER